MPAVNPDTTAALVRLLPQVAVALYESAPHVEARRAARERLTARQMRAVLYLAGGEPHTMGDIAAGLGIGRAAASEMVDRLVEKGVALRDADPDDRRVVRVRLAPQAHRYAARALAAWRARVDDALKRTPGLDPEALVAFLATLAAGDDGAAVKGVA